MATSAPDQRAQQSIQREAEKAVKLDRGPFRRISCRAHAFLYRLSGGRIGGRLDSASGQRPILLLTTTGRTSGKARTTPLVYLSDDSSWVVAASNAGRDSDPGWVHNLRADPKATIRVARTTIPVVAEELTPAEAASLWPTLDTMNAQYGEYRKLTTREVPVIRLRRR